MNSISPNHSGPVAVLPDGCVDLLWRDNRLTVAGPDLTAANPSLKPAATVIGLRFRPGAAFGWLRLPMTEIVGREVPLADLWGRKAERYADRIAEASTVPERLRVFQSLLADEAGSVPPPPPEATVIFEALDRDGAAESRKIPFLLDRLGVSERTLRRRGAALFGYGPTTPHRVLRLQRFRRLVLSNGGEPLAILALEAGYSDQAHLGRELQALCRMTAGELARQLTR